MDNQALANSLTGAGLIFGLIGLASIVFAIIVWWRIFSKAGYSGAMSLLLFVPIANIIVICMLAFAEWPILKELNALRQNARGSYAQFPANQPYPQGPQGPQYQQNPQYPQYPQHP